MRRYRHTTLFIITVMLMLMAVMIVLFEHDLVHASDGPINMSFCELCSTFSGLAIRFNWQFALFVLSLFSCLGFAQVTVECHALDGFRNTVSPRPPPRLASDTASICPMYPNLRVFSCLHAVHVKSAYMFGENVTRSPASY